AVQVLPGSSSSVEVIAWWRRESEQPDAQRARAASSPRSSRDSRREAEDLVKRVPLVLDRDEGRGEGVNPLLTLDRIVASLRRSLSHIGSPARKLSVQHEIAAKSL